VAAFGLTSSAAFARDDGGLFFIRLSNVVLPAPFGPTIPTRSPRMTRTEKFRTTK
jgi:hypothetical protein